MVYLFHKIVKGKKYYLLGENRQVNGQSKRISEVYLGSAEQLQKSIEASSIPKEVESLTYGLPCSLLRINDELKFADIINAHCPKRNQGLTVGEHVLLDIINRIDDPGSHNKLGRWFSKTVLRRIMHINAKYLSSQDYWNHWQYLDDKAIDSIQKDILPVLIENEDIKNLFYDPTNFTTFISDTHKEKPSGRNRHNITIANYGHAKNGLRGLRQINLALLVTKDYGIPLWHQTYEGNINDVTFFKVFTESMQDKIEIFLKKCQSITLVMDKGNNSPINIRGIGNDLHFYVLGSLTPSQHKDWLKTQSSEFNILYYTAKGDTLTAKYFRAEVFGKMCSVVITYNEKTAYKQRLRIQKALDKAFDFLKGVKCKLNKQKWKKRDEVLIRISANLARMHASNIINWKLIGNDNNLRLDFSSDNEELAYFNDSYGKTILFTDNDSLKSEAIIKAYHNKSIVEEDIKQLKNKHIISFSPQFCWTDTSIRVHAFTCVMALLFVSLLRKKARQNKLNLSNEEIVDHLRGIRQGLLLMPKIGKVIPIIENMDNIQKRLYAIFNLEKYESL